MIMQIWRALFQKMLRGKEVCRPGGRRYIENKNILGQKNSTGVKTFI